jgi:hypothetical protein
VKLTFAFPKSVAVFAMELPGKCGKWLGFDGAWKHGNQSWLSLYKTAVVACSVN